MWSGDINRFTFQLELADNYLQSLGVLLKQPVIGMFKLAEVLFGNMRNETD